MKKKTLTDIKKVIRINENYLGEVIKRYRVAKDWTQVHLADKADCSPSVISYIESGRGLPRFLLARKLAKALKLPAGEAALLRHHLLFNQLASLNNEDQITVEDVVNVLVERRLNGPQRRISWMADLSDRGDSETYAYRPAQA